MTKKVSLFSFLLIFLFSTIGFSREINSSLQGIASWYSIEACKFNPNPRCPTSSGISLYELERKEKLDPNFRFAASWKYPLGSKVKITNLANNKSIIAQILDRGPNKRFKNRVIDVSKRSAIDLGFSKQGLTKVRIEKIPS